MQEYDPLLEQAQSQLDEADKRYQDLAQHQAATMFTSEYQENLIRWQLDIKEEMERIEHLLRKHVPRRDEHGNEYFIESPKEEQLLNDHGVNYILNLLGWYLNKNIILSNFDDEQIQMRVHQFATRLTDYIHNSYEKMGLDNVDKLKEVPMIVMNLVNTVEAAYNRALHGGERESLRTARTVHQNEPIGYGNNFVGGSQQQSFPQKKFSILKPGTWGNKM